MLRRLPKGLLILIAVLTLVAAACSSDSDDSTETTAAEAATETTAAEATETTAAEATDTTAAAATETTAASEEAASGEEVVLNLWTFGAMCLDTVFAEWAEQNPGVTIEIKEAGYDEHHEALFAALATGEVPDMGAVEVGYSSLFRAAPDQFVDLNTLGAEDIAGDYLPWRWEHGVAADGRVIGVPTDTGGMAVAYRTDLFEAAGLPTDREEVSALWPTWEDFIEVGKQFVAASETSFIDSAGTVYDAILRQGEEMYYKTPDENGNTELIYETNPQNLKAWDLAMATIEADLSAAYSNFSPEWNAGMANGDYAVLMAPAWMMGYIQGQAPDTAGMWDIAAMPEGGGNWGGTQLTIPVRSENHELTYDLISYALAPEQQAKVFAECGNFPSTPALYDTPEIQGFTNPFFSDAPVGAIYADGALKLLPIYEGQDQRAIGREFGNGLDRVQQGVEDAATAWDTTIDAIKLEVGG